MSGLKITHFFCLNQFLTLTLQINNLFFIYAEINHRGIYIKG